MYMVSLEAIKTCAQGALGAMTFGAYHMYVTKSMMEINNEMLQKENKYNKDILDHKNELIRIEMEKIKKDNEELKKRLWF
jgi:hypothetical protein